MEEAKDVSKVRRGVIAAKVKAEQVLESETVEKMKNAATSTGKSIGNVCGFLTWEFKRLVSPLGRKFRSEIDKYEADMKEKK